MTVSNQNPFRSRKAATSNVLLLSGQIASQFASSSIFHFLLQRPVTTRLLTEIGPQKQSQRLLPLSFEVPEFQLWEEQFCLLTFIDFSPLELDFGRRPSSSPSSWQAQFILFVTQSQWVRFDLGFPSSNGSSGTILYCKCSPPPPCRSGNLPSGSGQEAGQRAPLP